MRQARGQTGTWSRGGGGRMGGPAPAIDLPHQLSGGEGEAQFPAAGHPPPPPLDMLSIPFLIIIYSVIPLSPLMVSLLAMMYDVIIYFL